MWRWLPSELCNKSLGCIIPRRIFFLQLIGIVFAVHVIVFFSYVIIGLLSKNQDHFKISLTHSGATYVLMPLQKKVDQKNMPSVSKSSYKKSNVIDHATYERKKNAAKKSKALIASKKHQKNSKQIKSSSKNNASLKEEQASVLMRTQLKSKLSLKKTKAVTKIQEVAQLQEIVPPEVKKEPEIEKVMQPVVDLASQQSKIEEVVLEDVQALALDDDFDENNVVFVGYEELDQSIIGSKIQQTIQQIWIAPVGMKKDIACEVQVKIGADGQALQAKVLKSSEVFVYDASARKALLAIEYPKEVYRKTITIVLGSS